MAAGIRHADFGDSCAAQVCIVSVPRPLYHDTTIYHFFSSIQIDPALDSHVQIQIFLNCYM